MVIFFCVASAFQLLCCLPCLLACTVNAKQSAKEHNQTYKTCQKNDNSFFVHMYYVYSKHTLHFSGKLGKNLNLSKQQTHSILKYRNQPFLSSNF